MKCLIIFDPDSSETLYVEHQTEGILAPQLQTIVKFIKGTIGQRPQFIAAGKLKIVFQYNDHIMSGANGQKSELVWFVLVSDDDDSETLLRNRLNLLNNLYSMILGNQLIDRKNGIKVPQQKLKRKMSQISATVNALFDESQSVLCQAYEPLEVNERLRLKFNKYIIDLLNQYPNNFDLFLLSVYCQIQMNPKEKTFYKRDETDADPMDGSGTPSSIAQEISTFENVSPRNDISLDSNSLSSPIIGHEDGMSGEDDMFETAPEDFDEPLWFLSSPFLSQLLDDTNASTTTTTTTTTNASVKSKEGVKASSSSDAIALLNYSLHFVGYLDESISKDLYTSITESAIKSFQKDNGLSETGEADFSTMKSILLKVKSSPQTLYANTRKKMMSDDPGNSQPDHVPANSTFEKIYFRNANSSPIPIWAYCAEIQKNTFILLLNKDMHQPNIDEEIEYLENSKKLMFDAICKQYGNFLLIKEQTNFSFTNVHHIPGLVHFILIDRTNHRIKAPMISKISGRLCRDESASHDMVSIIRKKVIKDKDFQYSYRLWVEDDESQEQTLEKDARYSSRSVYTDLVKRYYPHPVKCLELLTLYISSLPLSLVHKNNRVLNAILFEKEPES
eukprot:gene5926-6864_t